MPLLYSEIGKVILLFPPIYLRSKFIFHASHRAVSPFSPPLNSCLTVCVASWVINPGFHSTKFGCSRFLSSALSWDLSAWTQHGGCFLIYFWYPPKCKKKKKKRYGAWQAITRNSVTVHYLTQWDSFCLSNNKLKKKKTQPPPWLPPPCKQQYFSEVS